MSLLLALLAPPAPPPFIAPDVFDNAPEDEFEFWASEVVPLLDQDTPVTTFDPFDPPELLANEAEEDADLVATFSEDEPHGELIVEDEHIEDLELTLELRTVEDDAVAASSDDLEDEEPPQLESDASLPEQVVAPVTDAELLASASDELDEPADADQPAERTIDDAETPADPAGDTELEEHAAPGALALQVDDAPVVVSDAELLASNDGLEEPDEVTESLDTQLVDAATFISDNSELLALIDLEEAEVWDLELLAETHPDTLIAIVLRLRTLMGVGQ